MNPEIETSFASFVQDEAASLEQLRNVVGGEVAKRLDGSIEGLRLLDQYVDTITSDPSWETSAFFRQLPNAKKWLAVRVAYYFGRCLRERHNSQWYLCEDQDSYAFQMPAMAVNGIEISPLHIGLAAMDRSTDGGLTGVLRDLETAAFNDRAN